MTQPYQVEISGSAAQPRSDGGEDRTVGALVTGLWEKTETLVRQEMRLGITEAEEKVDILKVDLDNRLKQLKLELAAKAIGGAVAIGGALALVAMIVLLLAKVMAPWAAALVTGAVLSGIGAALLARDVKLPPLPSPAELVPQRTATSIKEDTKAIEEAIRDTTK